MANQLVPLNQNYDNFVSTWLQGSVDTSYAKLVAVFGEPHEFGDMDKTDAEWTFKTPDGFVVTIYNYKDGVAYLGSEGLPVEQIRDWHIGGNDPSVVQYVLEALTNESS